MAFCGKTTLYILGLLIFGSLNTMCTKLQFEMTSVGINGDVKHFMKPWFGTLTMFMGMVIVLVIHFIDVLIDRMRARGHRGEAYEALLEQPHQQRQNSGGKDVPSFWRAGLLILAPAAFDLIATTMSFVGLLYNSASVWQMLRGSMIIFSAIFSVLFLGRKLHGYHWFGVFMCVVAICLVGIANVMSGSSATSHVSTGLMVFGMVMIVASQVIQSLQIVTEEKLLKGFTIAPFHIVGMEGVWGTLILFIFIFPLLYFIPGKDEGSAENTLDTMVMIENNKNLQIMVGVYVVSVFTYNMAGMLVTYALSAVHRTMLEATRTAVIWICDLIIQYFVAPGSNFGEVWTTWSWLQLFGFVLLVMGQAVYSDLVKVPGFYYPPKAAGDEDHEVASKRKVQCPRDR
ncbi:conserved hypothetical protein [Perkinsus marinus ATCC 50983]|uniref:EamA domain-containing protein n=1 Tax=Perkinsus marinus (strain ATCC 50983 / TXsc) TaxID=423536 RepID=C5L483_PERM5|nr:conserved hypothetical protein [Perkinsus marinus ATCC 50983]EER08460.1 conserved hypothetical protein [Perkinsus marinus ATCC 50983]|eukprot:XP_002776644.1 conserved hypothetical protein [Perkinsus marinus ATCC 50983]